MSRLLAVLVAALTVLAAGCDDGRRSPGPELLDEVDVTPEITVDVDEDGFEPATLTIEPGEAFLVRNVGEGPHSVTSDDPFLDTGEILPGGETVVVLTTVGTVEIGDEANDDAKLVVTVSDRP